MLRFDTPLIYGYFESPVGQLLVAGDEEGLQLIGFPTEKIVDFPTEDWMRDDGFFRETFSQLSAYFAGELKEFKLQLKFNGTEFQKKVWTVLQDIPYGRTWSYGELAAQIGNPKASRAVGGANNANPLPIVIPCHRVIGADNSLTGFGGGLKTKQFLLDHEGITGGQGNLF